MKNDLIETDPSIMMGKPVIRGTRITVESILEKLAAGESIEQLLEAHPRLTREGVLAALSYSTTASFMSKLQEIKINAPADFAENFDLYMNGEMRIKK